MMLLISESFETHAPAERDSGPLMARLLGGATDSAGASLGTDARGVTPLLPGESCASRFCIDPGLGVLLTNFPVGLLALLAMRLAAMRARTSVNVGPIVFASSSGHQSAGRSPTNGRRGSVSAWTLPAGGFIWRRGPPGRLGPSPPDIMMLCLSRLRFDCASLPDSSPFKLFQP